MARGRGAATATFGLTPGLAQTGTLDYTTKAGYSVYKASTEALSPERYDCNPDEFHGFMKLLTNRAEAFGWTDMLKVPIDDTAGATKIDLLEEYGQITLERIKAFDATKINKTDRRAQNDRALYECLLKSLSPTGLNKVLLHRDEYVIEPIPADVGKMFPSGLCFLKVVIRVSHLDTNATTSMVLNELSNLDAYMQSIDSDIVKFNGHVKEKIGTLASRGHKTNDLLSYLFKGYGACGDKEFVEYMKRQSDDYDVCTEPDKAVTPAKLMMLAETKYNILVQKNIWKAPTSTEEKLMALKATIENLKKKTTALKAKQGPSDANDEKNKSGGSKRKKKNTQKEFPGWMTERPANADLKKPRMWNGKNWHWCSKETGGKCDGQYRVHKPHMCKGKAHKRAKKSDGGHNEKVTIDETLVGGYESD